MNLRVRMVAAAAVIVAAGFAIGTHKVQNGRNHRNKTFAKVGSGTPPFAENSIAIRAEAVSLTEAVTGSQLKTAIQRSKSKLVTANAPKRINYVNTPRARINADGVVVRRGPSGQHAKITTVAEGTEVRNLGRKGAWYRIKFAKGTVGYVRGGYLNRVPPKSYTVIKGDNDWSVARKLGISRAALHTANPRVSWTRLQLGQKLVVPLNAGTKPRLTAGGERINRIRTPKAKVNRENVIVRSGASTRAGKLALVEKGTVATILGPSGAWYKLKFPRGTVGYLRGDYLNEYRAPRRVFASARGKRLVATRTRRHSRARRSRELPYREATAPFAAESGGVALLAEATRHLGTRYRFGGSSTRGFDCSGFVKYVYGHAERVGLPRTSKAQATVGTRISRPELQKGDIVSFRTRGGSRVGHSGIYLGNGKFIHSSSAKGRVRIDSLDSGYYKKRFVGGRRVKASLRTVGDKTTKADSKRPQKAAPRKDDKAPPKQKQVPAERNPITTDGV